MSAQSPPNVNRFSFTLPQSPDAPPPHHSADDNTIPEYRPCYSFGYDRQRQWGGVYFFCSKCRDLETRYSGHGSDFAPFITSSKLPKYACQAKHRRDSDVPTHLSEVRYIERKRHKKKRMAPPVSVPLPTKRMATTPPSIQLDESSTTVSTISTATDTPSASLFGSDSPDHDDSSTIGNGMFG